MVWAAALIAMSAAAAPPPSQLTTRQVAQRGPEDPDYGIGPFNLIVRWGSSAPLAIRYENRARCELAALMVAIEGDALGNEIDQGGARIPAHPKVRGENAPWAFCIPG